MPIDPSFAVSRAPSGRSPPVEAPGATAGRRRRLRLDARRLDPVAAGHAERGRERLQALATGQATDPTAVVMAVERAQLAMQLAAQIRTKAVEAAQDIFHTQV